jgi:four helix bundle protein
MGVYREAREHPQDERFGPTAQLRRAAASVPANIAEGFARNGRFDKAGL